MSAWDIDDGPLSSGADADGFLAQLQSEQQEGGFATTTFGGFQDAEDELGLDELSEESDFSDDELVDVEEEDLGDNELRTRMNPFARTLNKYSKPRYLKKYFIISMASQIALFVALFTLQGVLGKMNSTIALVLIAGLLLAAQASQAPSHMNYDLLMESILAEEKAAGGTPEAIASLINKRERLLKWHGTMIFIPGLVAVFSTLIFLIGVFTVLFQYGVTCTDGTGVEIACDNKPEDGHEICASGPMAVWNAMPTAGWAFAIWHISTYGPVLFTLGLLSYTHFRAYNTEVDKNIEREAVDVAKGIKDGQLMEKEEERTEYTKEEGLMSKLMQGHLLRQLYCASLGGQVVSFCVLLASRSLGRPDQFPDTPGQCVDVARDTSWDPRSMAAEEWGPVQSSRWSEPAGSGSGSTMGDSGNLPSGFCEANQVECYSERPHGDQEITLLMLQDCCATCQDGPVESGGGVIYCLLVVGMFFWGYQCGELSTYLKRGKDVMDFAQQNTVHDITVRFRWHSISIFSCIIKAIVVTVMYFLTVLSLLYYLVVHGTKCPRSPIDAITMLTPQGMVMWLVVTICAGPVSPPVCKASPSAELPGGSHFGLTEGNVTGAGC